jgi:hypothetical protein
MQNLVHGRVEKEKNPPLNIVVMVSSFAKPA